MQTSLPGLLKQSPMACRVAPFVSFLILTGMQGSFGEASRYWIYALKAFLGGWMVWNLRGFIPEMKWRISWIGIITGVLVFVMWVCLDALLVGLGWKSSYPKLGASGDPWNPFEFFSENALTAWGFVLIRWIGSTLVVPPLEEVFYRSFVYRYYTEADFEKASLWKFSWVPFLVTCAIFASTHHEWLAALLCGFAYQGLVCRKRRLGDAITAHAVTNFLLGGWVIFMGFWKYW
ncbi:MAG TPA: CAAX prenyl protease-related protein [Verrucomicrobia bacterium]|nr:CAAX prenyl protease-related protein [Verrucomicrobiota bacterium]